MVEEKPEKRSERAAAKTPGRKSPRRVVERADGKVEVPPGDPWRVIAQVLNKQPRRKH